MQTAFKLLLFDELKNKNIDDDDDGLI